MKYFAIHYGKHPFPEEKGRAPPSVLAAMSRHRAPREGGSQKSYVLICALARSRSSAPAVVWSACRCTAWPPFEAFGILKLESSGDSQPLRATPLRWRRRAMNSRLKETETVEKAQHDEVGKVVVAVAAGLRVRPTMIKPKRQQWLWRWSWRRQWLRQLHYFYREGAGGTWWGS